MGAPEEQASFTIPPVSELLLAALVLCLVLIVIMPLPAPVIDFSISVNVTLGVVLLMMSLYVKKPLDMAAFPSIILVATMFRLALGIATTRSILAKGTAGEMVEAFGSFVTGGNLIVGAVCLITRQPKPVFRALPGAIDVEQTEDHPVGC